uniref:F-box domain-containing protein n=1 Tax=Chenopodium quinoa TaxID=63459 RepID=A0A803L891_CHEQI
MRNSRRQILWADLPVEILRSIAKRLRKKQDLQNFKSVCKKWRGATAISALLPYDVGLETLFSSSVFLLRPPVSGPPWLVTSVEITKGKFQFCHPLSGDLLPDIPENFSLDRFRPRCVVVDYHMADEKDKCNPSRALFCHDKVLPFFDDQSVPTGVDDGSLLVLFRGGQLGGSPAVRPEFRYGTELPWFDISYGSLDKFDDVVCFCGVNYVIDRVGKLYRMFTNQFAVLKTLVEKPVIKPDCVSKGSRKRLVGLKSSGDMFLIRRSNDLIKVYKLCKFADKKSWSWVKVESFGDDYDPKVLFVLKSSSFFVSAAEFPGFELGNCIIFSNSAFRPYSKPGESKVVEEKIQYFKLGEHDHDDSILTVGSPGSPLDFYSPPSWVLQAQSTSSPSHSQWQPRWHVFTRTCLDSLACTKIQGTKHIRLCSKSKTYLPPPGSDKKHEEDTSKKASAAETTPEIPSVLASKDCESNHKFQSLESLDIKPNLLSTLQLIWNKHDILVGKYTVQSKDMLTCALESLAKLIITLQNTTARTLTDSLAKDLESVLYDLHCARLSVGWLVPFVQRALALHKNKPLIEYLMAIDKEKAQVDKEERDFLARTAQVKQELEERRACLSAKISIPEPINLDQSLGEGLF